MLRTRSAGGRNNAKIAPKAQTTRASPRQPPAIVARQITRPTENAARSESFSGDAGAISQRKRNDDVNDPGDPIDPIDPADRSCRSILPIDPSDPITPADPITSRQSGRAPTVAISRPSYFADFVESTGSSSALAFGETSSSFCALTARLKFLIALPSPSPSCGSFVDPKTTTTIRRMRTSSPKPNPKGMIVLLNLTHL
jgi:hypothetical protein